MWEELSYNIYPQMNQFDRYMYEYESDFYEYEGEDLEIYEE